MGIRARPNAITIAIYDSSKRKVINVEEIKIPNALSIPEALKYVRNNVLDVLREYEIKKAAVRIIESSAQTTPVRRVEIEGVVQEAFASSGLVSYLCGQISTLSARMGIARKDFKRYVEGELTIDCVDNWADLTKEQREAVMAAIGAANV
jgi:Holliday junction resolvasome RuvABC endonuclease subunit